MTDLADADYGNPLPDLRPRHEGRHHQRGDYPHAVCELAQTYRFVNISTYAGAIASPPRQPPSTAGLGLQEARRAPRVGRRGDEPARSLPAAGGRRDALPDRHREPDGGGRMPLAAFARLRRCGGRRRPPARRVCPRNRAARRHRLKVIAILAGLLVALIGLVGASQSSRDRRDGPSGDLCDNKFGLCSGMPSSRAGDALSPWLTGLIDDLSGRSGKGPLTFGKLREKGIELVMVTTDITHRVRRRLPVPSRELFFDSAGVEDAVSGAHRPVDGGAPTLGTEPARSKAMRDAMLPRLPLPRRWGSPVVVAARRASASLLISAVPLWALDLELAGEPAGA